MTDREESGLMIEFKRMFHEAGKTEMFMRPAEGTAATQRSWEWNAGQRGLTGGLLRWFRRRSLPASRLAMIERIVIGPRQTLVLVEADGTRLLVATGSDGAPSFFQIPPVSGAHLSGAEREHAAFVPASDAGDCPERGPDRVLSQGLSHVPGKARNSARQWPRPAVHGAARFGVQGRVSW